MEQIAITSQYDIESRKKLVRYIAGMSGGDREALSKETQEKKVSPRWTNSHGWAVQRGLPLIPYSAGSGRLRPC